MVVKITARISGRKTTRLFKVDGIAMASKIVREFLDAHDLGASAFYGANVIDGDRRIADISPNGRAWHPESNREIVFA